MESLVTVQYGSAKIEERLKKQDIVCRYSDSYFEKTVELSIINVNSFLAMDSFSQRNLIPVRRIFFTLSQNPQQENFLLLENGSPENSHCP
jgi:hypothetical protein